MVWNARLDFRRLPGPVFDPPRRETAGRGCTRRHVLNFLWSSNILIIGCVFYGSELTDSWKQTKLNGKVSDLPDRISNVLNVPLSNINVDGYISDICNEHSYRSRPKAT